MASTINAKNTSTGVVITPDASGQLELQTADTTRMTIDVNGNVAINTTGARIQGDFSNATLANRVAFQTSTTNGATVISAIPNGTGTSSFFAVFPNSDPSNTGYGYIASSATEVTFRSVISGTGSYLPMTFYTGGGEKMRIDTSGNVGIGTSSPTQLLTLSSGATPRISLKDTRASVEMQVLADNIAGYSGTVTNYPYIFVTNNAERMRITSNGGIAFGGASNFGSSGQVLQSNGDAAPSWTTISASAFPAGTRMSFQQTSAPTGWTKDTTAAINDSILRLVTGSVTSGGSTAFSTFNGQTATGATTLSTTQMPSHTHTVASGSTSSFGSGGANNTNINNTINTGATGGGGSHTHSMTTAIKYYDFIIASKD